MHILTKSFFCSRSLVTPAFRMRALFIVFLFIALSSYSQIQISGTVIEENGSVLPGSTIRVLTKDSSFITGTVTDANGNFTLSVAPNAQYTLLFTHISYFGLSQFLPITIKTEALEIGKVRLHESKAKKLKEVEIVGVQTRGEQKEDTTSFKADAFKTHPDATAEDLIKKMPGVTSDNTGMKVNGETVRKVLVDGKPFFGDDPNAAVKNLPADIIDRVEIFDRMSDQSAFTGFNDGDQQKTINLVTKKGKNVGQFGKVFGGYGMDERNNPRYQGGATLNSFKGKRRISVLLLSNNINQQNFSMSDISGAMGNSGQGDGGRGGPGGGGMGGASSLLATPQTGNTTTQSAGLNYSDAWGSKINVSGSYFFNYSDNKNVSNITRTYFTDNQLLYKQDNTDLKTNQNHRLNFRLEYAIDSTNKLIITPSLNLQNFNGSSQLNGSNSLADLVFLSRTTTHSNNVTKAYDFSNAILYQHKLKKVGRTISLNIATQLGEKNNDGSYFSSNTYNDTLPASGLDQQYKTYSNNKKVSANLSYTEPLNKNANVQLNYNPSYNSGMSSKLTDDYNTLNSVYSDLNIPLSNKYDNVYQTQRAGLSYRYRKDKINLSLGADAQQSTLNGNQQFPSVFRLNQTFQNILPNAMLNYKVSKARNLRIYMRSATNIPTISQLQNVIDISNPLQIKSGNDQLKQTFENNLNIRYGGFDAKTSRNLMFFLNGNFTNNYISNATYMLRSDTTIQGYTLKSGSQLSKPVNLNNFYSARAFFVYGFPVKQIKSNVNFNGGINYQHSPSLINNLLNYSNNYASNAGVYIGSNVSEKLDFSLGYNGSYTLVKNTTQKKSDNSYFTHTATCKVNWIFFKGFVINTDVSHTLYNGLSQSFNQQYFLWNAYVGYKFLKNRSLEAKVSVFDILNQNRSISRTINANYTEDTYTSVLRRYAMFTLTYTIKNFKNGLAPKAEEQPNMFPGGPPPGMRPPGGGYGGPN